MPTRGLPLTIFTLFLLYFCTLLQSVGAVSKNISIDDQNGDGQNGMIPTYAPQGAWANQACGGCAIKPDPNQLFEHTATAATFMPDKNVTSNTIDFDFNGTAIYIFFTLFYNEGDGITVNTECNFTIDNEAPVFFNHSGDPTAPAGTKRDYRKLVFSKTGLEYQPHHMQIRMSDVSYHVFLSFDYAEYTIDEAISVPINITSITTVGSTNPTIGSNNPQQIQTASPTSTPSSSSKTFEPPASLVVLGILVYQFVKVLYMG